MYDAIETERGNLSRAESLLGCLAASMEYETDSADKPYYPDVARLARELVRQSINGLDSLALERHLLRDKVKEDTRLPIDRACAIAARKAGAVGAFRRGARSDLIMISSGEHALTFASGTSH